MKSCLKLLPFIISVTAAILVTAAVIFAVFYGGGGKKEFSAVFYAVCYRTEDDALSADAISENVSGLGGAGYVLEYGGKYYITVALYYSSSEAEKVVKNLLDKGVMCEAVKLERTQFNAKDKNEAELFGGNLNTLISLSKLCYDCANSLDGGEYGQQAAKGVLADIEKCLDGLEKANKDNCFFGELERLKAECRAAGGFIYSKNMRKLQIAIIDTVINIDLY